jgi:hypothetical protein
MRNLAYVFSILLMLVSAPSFACSCGEMPTLEAWYNTHNTVAIVKVIEVKLGSEVSYYTDASTGKDGESTEYFTEGYAELVESLKGSPKKKIRITGSTPSYGCYVPHVVGVEYVVFMSEPGNASFNYCAFPRAVNQIPKSLIDQWRRNASNK